MRSLMINSLRLMREPHNSLQVFNRGKLLPCRVFEPHFNALPRRVALARAAYSHAKYVLLDDVFSNGK